MASPGSFSAGGVLTAAEMNALPGGLLASSSRTTPFYGGAAFASVMNVTFTAQAGRTYRFTFLCGNALSTGSSVRMQMKFVDDLSVEHYRAYHGSTNVYGDVLTLTTVTTFTAGSRVLDLQAYRDNGTTTTSFYADALTPMRLWIEDIGPT